MQTQRRFAILGVVAPLGFLAISFSMAAVRPELIRAEGWAGWPSSMALGGWLGLPQTLAFLGLAVAYPLFALGAVRPILVDRAAWGGFLGVAVGDFLLAFTTDPPGADLSLHGGLHVGGVLVVTGATMVTAIGVTTATRRDPAWRLWRVVGAPMAIVACAIGLVGGLDAGWAKVVFVVGITLPVPIVATLLLRGLRGARVAPPSPHERAQERGGVA